MFSDVEGVIDILNVHLAHLSNLMLEVGLQPFRWEFDVVPALPHELPAARRMWLVFASPGRPADWSIRRDSVTGAILQPEGLHGTFRAMLPIPESFRDAGEALGWLISRLKQHLMTKATYDVNFSYRNFMARGDKHCWSRDPSRLASPVEAIEVAE